jgi:hypothetical protein
MSLSNINKKKYIKAINHVVLNLYKKPETDIGTDSEIIKKTNIETESSTAIAIKAIFHIILFNPIACQARKKTYKLTDKNTAIINNKNNHLINLFLMHKNNSLNKYFIIFSKR